MKRVKETLAVLFLSLVLGSSGSFMDNNIILSFHKGKTQEEVTKMLDRIEKKEGFVLDGHQREAVFDAAGSGVLIITGGPVTGKATTLTANIKYLE